MTNTPAGGPGDGADPMAQLAEGAMAVRRLFSSYVHVGFNEAQALHLTGLVLMTTLRNTNAPNGGTTE